MTTSAPTRTTRPVSRTDYRVSYASSVSNQRRRHVPRVAGLAPMTRGQFAAHMYLLHESLRFAAETARLQTRSLGNAPAANWLHVRAQFHAGRAAAWERDFRWLTGIPSAA